MLSPSLTQIFLPSLVTARNSSCGKVIFSQACVIPSVHGEGGVYPSMQWGTGCLPRGCLPRGGVCLGVCLPRGCLPWGGVFPGVCLPWGVSAMGVCLPRGCLPRGDTTPGTNTPSETATAAGGTHPTEMHSCLLLVLTWVINSK